MVLAILTIGAVLVLLSAAAADRAPEQAAAKRASD